MLDADDRCPTEAGPASAAGCPNGHVDTEINQRIEFEPGRTKLLPSSIPILTEVQQALAPTRKSSEYASQVTPI